MLQKGTRGHWLNRILFRSAPPIQTLWLLTLPLKKNRTQRHSYPKQKPGIQEEPVLRVMLNLYFMLSMGR